MTVTSNVAGGTWTRLDTAAIATATLEQRALVSEHQIPLAVGDVLAVKEVSLKQGWYRGTNLSSGLTGVFPMSYALVKKSEGESFDVVINELVTVIREWGGILKMYYKEKRMQDYRVMKERLFELMQWHTQIFSSKSTPEVRDPLKKKVLDKIQEGRLLMGLDMVVRTTAGDVADETNTGVIPLYRMHQELANSTTEQKMDHAQPQPLSPGAPRKKDDTLFHLFLDFKIFMCSVGETTELYFSLYNKGETRFVSDEYQIVLTAQGMPTDIDKMGKLSTIFTDISKKDLTGLYLVCRLVRKGRMLVDQKETKKEKLGTPVRRPFGCAVLNLEGNVNVHSAGTKHKLAEHTIPIYATNQESLFPTLHELIIKGQFNSIQEVPRAKGVCIGLALYTGEYQQLAKEPLLTAVWPTGKLGMPDIILPGFARNDMFVMVEGGEYLKDRKTAQKNVEVIMQLVLENGEVVKDAIFTGSDKSKQEQRTIVYYHSNQPHWNEYVRVALPPVAKLSQAYLVLYSRHVSTTEGKEKPPICVSYLKITNPDGTIIADKNHNLLSYKPGKSMEEPVPNLKDPGMAKLLRQGEVLRIRTVLCSTMCTQNIALLSLLKWQSYAGDLSELMNRFTFVDQGEIIKFIQEIFDSMFAMLDSNKITHHESVYHAIVFTTSLLVDERTSYTNFRPVLDVYILNHLKSIRAHTHLISCLKSIFANMQTNSTKTLMPTLKSLEYVIKFIVVSWLNYLKTNPQDKAKQQTNFKNEIMSVLTQINTLMQKPEREFIGAQTIALKNFMSIFNDLEKIFVVSERTKIAIDFIDSVKFDESRRLLNLEKLLLILNLVESELFLKDEVRGIMLPTLVRNLKQHLGGAVAEDVLKCGTILMKVIESLQVRLKDKSAPAPLLSSQISQLTGVLPEALASIRTLGRTSRARLDLIHCVFCIFYLMEPSHFELFLKDEKGMPRKQYLLTTFDILQNILSTGTAYPENWFTLMVFQYFVIRKVILEMTRQVLLRAKQVGKSAPLKPKLSTNLAKLNVSALELQTWSNTPIGQEYDIWVSYLKLCIEFSKAKGLALENFSENKQRVLKSRNGDLRTDVIQALKSLWDALGQHQIHLLDDAVGPFLELVVINQPTIRTTGLSLYISLLRSEFNDTKALVAMEKATINTLDRLLNDSAAPPSIVDNYRAFYSQTLPEKFVGSDALSVRAQKFFKDTSMFLDLLYELRTLPNTIEYEDDRTVATMKLMAYLKQSDRRDTYVKYVHKLSNQHLSSNLFIEAGLTILLHADLLEWNDDIVDELPDIGYPSETQRGRKERLFKLSIEYLDKGKAWEKAIHLLGQLRELYENAMFDYPKLADTLQTESTFYRKIVGVDRFFAEYFRVGYYGKGFESNIQNKEFIYRGFELERMADFAQRVQAKFPDAKQLTYTETPPPEILNGNGQWLQIFAVKPHCEEIEKSKRAIPLPNAIAKYKQSNDVQVFLYSKPFKKTKTANEFADLWLSNVYYYTEDRFPTTHRRSEIIKKSVTELPPIDNAYNAVKNKNGELAEMSLKYERGTEQNINPFTMVLKGVIDAAVNGGVKRYQEAFFVPEYVTANPTHAQRVEELKQCLYDQVNVLETALGVLGKICPPEMIGLLEQLENLFDDMTTEMGMKKPCRFRKSVARPGTPTNSSPSTPVISRPGTSSAPGTPVSNRRAHE